MHHPVRGWARGWAVIVERMFVVLAMVVLVVVMVLAKAMRFAVMALLGLLRDAIFVDLTGSFYLNMRAHNDQIEGFVQKIQRELLRKRGGQG